MPTLEKLQRETPGSGSFDESLVVPVFAGTDFTWSKGSGSSTTSRLGLQRFPKSFYIKSHRSTAQLKFVADGTRNEANEFFDGEGSAFISETGLQVMIWVGDNV